MRRISLKIISLALLTSLAAVAGTGPVVPFCQITASCSQGEILYGEKNEQKAWWITYSYTGTIKMSCPKTGKVVLKTKFNSKGTYSSFSNFPHAGHGVDPEITEGENALTVSQKRFANGTYFFKPNYNPDKKETWEGVDLPVVFSGSCYCPGKNTEFIEKTVYCYKPKATTK